MRRNVKIVMIIVSIALLAACSEEVNEASSVSVSSTPDPSTFSLATDLRIDYWLDELITMQVDVLLDEQILSIVVINDSDHEINIGSQSPNRVTHPSLQYFDGENWRSIPRCRDAFIAGYGFADGYDLENKIASGVERHFSLNLNNYHIPESNGSFRVVLTARGTDPDRGYGVHAEFRHDFFAEFTLE